MHGYRISFLTGLATGYVLGTRAGRERYEQLKKVARTVAENPAVQQAAGAAQAQATGLVSAAGSRVTESVRERVPQLAKTARAKVGEHKPGRRGQGGHNGHGDHVGNGSGDMGESRRFTPMGHGEPH
jgi:hypothetical protein